jgi:succinyl-CoA synthetase alpha subunit
MGEAMKSVAILLRRGHRVVVQGITGRQGAFHTRLMRDYGTRIVAGVTPGKGGSKICGINVYDTMVEAQGKHQFDVSAIFVPAPFTKEAALEAIDAGIKLVVIVTEHIPIKDSIEIMERAKAAGVSIVGPNCPGVITPGESKVGVMPAHIFTPGVVGVVSRSGTLTYEVAWNITGCGLGQTTCVGIGGDPVTGLSFIDVLRRFETDDQTRAVVLLGEIGGNSEEMAAQYIEREGYTKPIVAYVAGSAAPPGKCMGHAGAIVTGTRSTAKSKIEALAAAGVAIAEKPSDVATILTKKV